MFLDIKFGHRDGKGLSVFLLGVNSVPACFLFGHYYNIYVILLNPGTGGTLL